MKKTNKNELFVTTLVFLWILVVNIAAALLGLVGWPMFFVPIFFFIQGADVKKIPSIFIGAALGLLASLFLVSGLHTLIPTTGLVFAFVVIIAIILAVIIIGGTVLPIACNNVAFAYLTANTIHLEEITPQTIMNNLLVLFIGGGIMLGGAILVSIAGKKMLGVMSKK